MDNLSKQVSALFQSLGNKPELAQVTAKAIKRMVDDVIAIAHTETAIVIVRTSKANTQFDVPRWHIDGPFSGAAHEYKVIVTLKGPATLLYAVSENDRKAFNKIAEKTYSAIDQNDPIHKESRKKLANLLNDKARLLRSELYEGIAFIMGDPPVSAVHSEPKMDSERVFLSIVPMNKADIEERDKILHHS